MSFGQRIADQIMAQATHALGEMSAAEDLSPADRTLLFTILYATAKELGGRLITDYSGRCMYGRECVAIVCRSQNDYAFALAQACFEESKNPKEIRELLGEPATDSLGKDTIIYWPRLLTNVDLEED